MQETPRQCWGAAIYGLYRKAIFHAVKKGNLSYPLHCRYKELIIFIIAYFLMHCPPCSVLHILFMEAPTENYPLK